MEHLLDVVVFGQDILNIFALLFMPMLISIMLILIILTFMLMVMFIILPVGVVMIIPRSIPLPTFLRFFLLLDFVKLT